MNKNNRLCHCCGNAIGQNDSVIIEKIWGYFSKDKDGEKHTIRLCETCYDAWIQTFVLKPEIEEMTEFM